MNMESAVEKVIEFLENNNVAENFEGVDVSLNCSLYEYGFIHSKENNLAIYINEYGKLDFFVVSEEDLREWYIEPFENDGWANDKVNGFLSYCGYENIGEMLGVHISTLVVDFHSYFGISDSYLRCSGYDTGYELDEVDKLLENIANIILADKK